MFFDKFENVMTKTDLLVQVAFVHATVSYALAFDWSHNFKEE
jgi:hypothetical protein